MLRIDVEGNQPDLIFVPLAIVYIRTHPPFFASIVVSLATIIVAVVADFIIHQLRMIAVVEHHACIAIPFVFF